MHMHRETANIPVVVCTAAVNEVRTNEGYLKSMGVSVVLKPFDIDVLLEVVKDALASPPANEQRQHGADQAKGSG